MRAPKLVTLGLLTVLGGFGGAPAALNAQTVAQAAAPEGLPVPLTEQLRGIAATAAELDAKDAPGEERANAHGTLGHLYFYYDLPAEATAAYERAASADPSSFRWPYHLGVVAMNHGDGPAATRFLRQAALLAPDSPQLKAPIYLRLGQLALDQGDPSAAETSYRAALALDDTGAAGWYGLGRAQLASDRAEEAVASLERSLAADEAAEAVRYSLAQAYRAAGRADDARAAIERLAPDWAARRPSYEDPLMAGVARTTALSSFGLVMALAADADTLPDLQFYRFAVGTLGNVGGAVQGVIQAIETWPADKRRADARTLARLSYLVGGLLLEGGRAPDALNAFATALEFDANLRPARVERALLLRRLERDGEAAAELATAFAGDAPGAANPSDLDPLDLDPLMVEGRLALAAYRLAAGDAASSVPLFEAVVAVWPEDPRGPVGLAEALVRLERRDEAGAVLRSALERARDVATRAVLEERLKALP